MVSTVRRTFAGSHVRFDNGCCLYAQPTSSCRSYFFSRLALNAVEDSGDFSP
jgi:hypothetical protein